LYGAFVFLELGEEIDGGGVALDEAMKKIVLFCREC
jgi:hypothetical protein